MTSLPSYLASVKVSSMIAFDTEMLVGVIPKNRKIAMMPFFSKIVNMSSSLFDKVLNLIFNIAQEVLGIGEDILVQF